MSGDLNGSFGKPEGLVGTLGTDKSLNGYLGAVGSLTGELGGSLIPGPQGPKGEKGDKGDKGDTGPKGDKGEPGERGPTGETGPQGPQGEIGPAGPKGERGEKGDTGDVGPVGPAGEQGEKGDKGDTGDVGPVGPAGATGPMGPQGDRGPKGDTGDTGPQGLKGDKGDKGDPGDDYILTHQDKEDIAGLVDVPVTDVQINGVSAVNNGVAEIPVADANNLGVLKIGSDYGISKNSVNRAYIQKATNAQIKSGSGTYRPITPDNQNNAVFYGLAKAAGDTTQSASSNAVGAYTDEAKTNIQSMLGVPQLFINELIADVTVPEDTANFTVNTDINGQPFNLRKGAILVDAPATLTGNRDYLSTSAEGMDTANVRRYVLFPTCTWSSASMSIFYFEFELFGGMLPVTKSFVFPGYSRSSNSAMSGALSSNAVTGLYQISFKQYNANHTLIPAGTRILIYGIRA